MGVILSTTSDIQCKNCETCSLIVYSNNIPVHQSEPSPKHLSKTRADAKDVGSCVICVNHTELKSVSVCWRYLLRVGLEDVFVLRKKDERNPEVFGLFSTTRWENIPLSLFSSSHHCFDQNTWTFTVMLFFHSAVFKGYAVCMYNMEDIRAAFNGPFAHREKPDHHWSVYEGRVPFPRPGSVSTRMYNSAMCRNLIVLSEPQNVTACFTHAFVPRHIVSFGSPPSLNVGSHFIRRTNLMTLFSAWLCTWLFCSSVSRRSIHVNVWNWAFVRVRLNRGFKWLRSDLFSLCLICADECPSVAEDKKVRLASSSYSRNSQVLLWYCVVCRANFFLFPCGYSWKKCLKGVWLTDDHDLVALVLHCWISDYPLVLKGYNREKQGGFSQITRN